MLQCFEVLQLKILRETDANQPDEHAILQVSQSEILQYFLCPDCEHQEQDEANHLSEEHGSCDLLKDVTELEFTVTNLVLM